MQLGLGSTSATIGDLRRISEDLCQSYDFSFRDLSTISNRILPMDNTKESLQLELSRKYHAKKLPSIARHTKIH